jgi:hypothetical protein
MCDVGLNECYVMQSCLGRDEGQLAARWAKTQACYSIVACYVCQRGRRMRNKETAKNNVVEFRRFEENWIIFNSGIWLF